MAQILSSYLIQSITTHSSEVKTYRFSYGMTPFEFYSGQFVVVSHPGDEKCTAPVTLSSSPVNRKFFTITIRKKGNFGSRFYNEAKEGDLVNISAPMGKFHIKNTEFDPIVYIAKDHCVTGGMSMAQYIVDSGSNRRFYMLHELTAPHQALFENEFKAITKPEFRYLQVQQIDEDSIKKLTSSIPYPAQYYVAGEGEDVMRLKDLLGNEGIPTNNLNLERWS